MNTPNLPEELTGTDINTEEQIAEHANKHIKLYPVVAIGASAGGLEAISAFLQHIPTNLGLVYVIIQHLSPSYESILPELLERRTAMPVHKVENDMPIHPDNVYVIPPDAYMSIMDSKLTLSSRFKTDGGYHSVDYFMTALARVYHNLAIGVVLSGTATDGTEGIQHIKAEGGITFAQDETARFQGMPRSAAESGFIDFIMSPEGIADELTKIVQEPYGLNRIIKTGESVSDQEMKKIQAILHNRKNVDFSHYKQTTIKRRILRRMALKRLSTLEDYTKLLRTDASELDLLYRDLLINVTSFFRDPDVYNALTEIIFPELLKNRKPNDPIRIWCPACATGEEACSIAIVLFEFLKENALTTPIQIFGTDLSETAIDRARTGLFAPNAMQSVSPQRQKRFFIKTNGKFQITKAIRDVCIFAQQNLLQDPPFSRLDLISCQNVMIYLEPAPQKKILQAFHYGLKLSGFLLLGKSESITSAADLFAQADKDLKVYTKKPNSQRLGGYEFLRQIPQLPEVEAAELEEKHYHEREGTIDVDKESDRLLLGRYVPASIVVNNDLQIYRFHGPIYKYMQPASGKATLNLLKMVRDELLFEMRSLIHRAKREGHLVRKEGIPLTTEGRTSTVNIEVAPIKANSKEAYYLVLFDEKLTANQLILEARKVKPRKPAESEQKIISLEYELKETREQMRIMTEEFEATREELQSANEEILSSNEELQSINEELETSKEELQSTNEELTTINEELQIRNNDLKESIDYSIAIVETIREPLLLLNADLRIRTANKAFYRTYKLMPRDVEGQFLYEIDGGRWNVPDLLSKLSEVAGRKKGFLSFELVNTLFKDRTLLFNAMHLEVDDKKKDRILLSVEDVTLQSQAQQNKEWLAAVVDSSGEGIISFTTSRTVISWNKGAEAIFGYPADEMIGKSVTKLALPENKSVQLKLIERAVKGETIRQHEIAWVHKDGHSITVTLSVSAIRDERGIVQGITVSVQDITERKQSEEKLKLAQQSLQVAVEAANMGIWEIDLATNIVQRSLRHDQIYGYETIQPEWTVEMARTHLLEEDKPLFDAALATMMQTGRLFMELRIKRPNDGVTWLQAMGRVIYDDNGKPIRSAGIIMDITERKTLERQKEEFIGIASHELKTPVTSIKAYAQILHAQFLEAKDMTSAGMLEKLDKQVDRLTKLIKDLLDVTQIAEGQLTLHKEVVDINELVKEVAEDMQHSAVKHTIVTLLRELPKVVADKERIGQVITNLVSNAIKYSPDADKVIIRTEADAATITVSVQDFGIGMKKEAQEKVFNRFFRAYDLKTSTFPGLGLGLFISSEIVKRHGGTISLKSEEGIGSVFYFTLPLKN